MSFVKFFVFYPYLWLLVYMNKTTYLYKSGDFNLRYCVVTFII